MARIRTVKPELFRHEELYELEQEYKLPLRLAFIGLWCVCDREGRFKWRPNQLKIEILPYDKIDFSRVLDALATRGFVVEYTSDTGERYGYVPTFTVHQVINNRESQSQLLCPFDACATRDPRGLSMHKGKGKERKGIGKEGNGKEKEQEYSEEFLEFWEAYPRKDGSKREAFVSFTKAIKTGVSHETITRGSREYANHVTRDGTEQKFVKHAQTWLNQRCWESDYARVKRNTPQPPPGKSQQATDAVNRALASLKDPNDLINRLGRT